MWLWMAALFLLGGCMSDPQAETSETKIEAQGKAIERAADAMVNEALLEFEVSNTTENEAVTNSGGTASNMIKPASQ